MFTGMLPVLGTDPDSIATVLGHEVCRLDVKDMGFWPPSLLLALKIDFI